MRISRLICKTLVLASYQKVDLEFIISNLVARDFSQSLLILFSILFKLSQNLSSSPQVSSILFLSILELQRSLLISFFNKSSSSLSLLIISIYSSSLVDDYVIFLLSFFSYYFSSNDDSNYLQQIYLSSKFLTQCIYYCKVYYKHRKQQTQLSEIRIIWRSYSSSSQISSEEYFMGRVEWQWQHSMYYYFYAIFLQSMKYLISENQLNELLQLKKVMIVIFVEDSLFMPSESLLNYLSNHRIAQEVDNHIFIWKIVDEKVYQRYQVESFPQLTILKQDKAEFSFIGYNKEKTDQALSILCQNLGLGKVVKKMKEKYLQCPKGHNNEVIRGQQQQNYARGCFQCNACHRLSHFDKNRPTLHCSICNFDVCFFCGYQDYLQ